MSGDLEGTAGSANVLVREGSTRTRWPSATGPGPSASARAAAWTFRSLGAIRPREDALLTVLCYHRVGTPRSDQFYGYRRNFSVSTERFADHMRLLRSAFTPISSHQLVLFLEGKAKIPANPALVTFDDGYSDNGAQAWPILRHFGIPATVFLATDHISLREPYVWDFAAFCFETSRVAHARCPLLGPVELRDLEQREDLTSAWMAALKTLPSQSRAGMAAALADALEVTPPRDAFSSLYLTWDQVRALKREGLDFGGHTRTHPILSRTDPEEAEHEIAGCQDRLRQELGDASLAFAYPNGGAKDFTPDHEALTKAAGFRVAFSLNAGSASLKRIRERPTAVRRIYVNARDTRARLAAKLARHVWCGE